MPTSIVASNSSAAISVNCLQPGVQCCSDCGSVNKFQTSCEGAGNMKRPSIFIYQLHRHCIIQARSLCCSQTDVPLRRTSVRWRNPPLRVHGSDMSNVTQCQISFRHSATMTFGYANPSVWRQFIDFGALAYGAD